MVEALAHKLRLAAEERSQLLPSGSAFLFDNRVGWARTYLKQAGLLESPKRGVLRITERGKATLTSRPARIDVKFLEQFAEFRQFRTRRPEVQKFAGALQGHRASKGVFITTSSFTREAEDYANAINTKLILINGAVLTDLMIDHNVGVATTGTYELKRVDADYFEGE